MARFSAYLQKPDFVIEILYGHARVVRGAALAKFIHACNSISERHHINSGCILGFTRNCRTQLKFYGDIPHYLRSMYRKTHP